MKAIIKSISESFMQEALSSPRMLEDLAAMEKYMSESYDGRTFVELLQNADDAGASRIKVFSINGALVVANDGRPFNENDIMAICRSGASSKQRGSNIGYRGVGFKSATTISTEIVIYSAGAYFTFSKSVCAQALHKSEDKVPTVRIPFSYKESDLDEKLVEAIEVETGEGFTTFFIFLDGKIKKFIQELDGFNAGWLLFLKRFFRNCPSYPFSNISLAVNNSLPQRPYMVRFIIFNLLFVPSTKPFDRGLATAFSTADKSFSSPDAKRESSFKSLFLYFSIKRYKYGMFFF